MSATILLLSLFAADSTPLNLQPVANVSIKDGFQSSFKDNNFAGFDMEDTTEGGVQFKFGKKFIAFLPDPEPATNATPTETPPVEKGPPADPAKAPAVATIKGIKVARSFAKLSVVHAAQYHAPNDEGTVGWYVLHFKGGEKHRLPIVYGRHVVDWWEIGDEKVPSDGEVFWEGTNVAIKGVHQDRGKIRLFRSQFDNPKPEVEVETIDFECASGQCKPFVFAMTVH